MKAGTLSSMVLILTAVGCDNAPTYDLGRRTIAASGSEYWHPRCWNGRNVVDAPERLEALMAVRPAGGKRAYVSFLSRDCDANVMQVEEFEKYPSILRLEDTANLFVIENWPDGDKSALAKTLGADKVIYQLSHAVAITEDVEFYSVEIEVGAAEFGFDQQEYLGVEIISVTNPEKLNVSGWIGDFR